MKKNKIIEVILWIIIFLFLANVIMAYISYTQVSDEKEPSISFDKKEIENKTVYNEGLYKVVVEEDKEIREVSLKLFFLK